MNNLDCMAIREFRRFAVTHIYPETIQLIVPKIQEAFNTNNQIIFEPLPQSTIKFICGLEKGNNNALFLENIHMSLKVLFIDYFNNPFIIKTIRNKIYNNIFDNETKNLLNKALSEIQLGNPQYVCLLFNITILDKNVYVYL